MTRNGPKRHAKLTYRPPATKIDYALIRLTPQRSPSTPATTPTSTDTARTSTATPESGTPRGNTPQRPALARNGAQNRFTYDPPQRSPNTPATPARIPTATTRTSPQHSPVFPPLLPVFPRLLPGLAPRHLKAACLKGEHGTTARTGPKRRAKHIHLRPTACYSN